MHTPLELAIVYLKRVAEEFDGDLIKALEYIENNHCKNVSDWCKYAFEELNKI